MQKKDDKVGNKTANKQERQRKKESKREGSKSIRKKGLNFGFFACMHDKQKSGLVEKYAFFLAKPIFSHSYAN